jgi:hypothetical protein
MTDAFGLDTSLLSKIDWKLALQRVIHDQRSDFVYAPHLGFIYRRSGDELIDSLTKQLAAGEFSPGVPVTVEVPKAFRIRVKVTPERLGPSYSRPGSILLPRDRVLYQALADQAVVPIQQRTDLSRSFSHLLADPSSASMFLPTRQCWNELQRALAAYAKSDSIKYILKLDIANFFGSLNQHTLINELNDAGYPKALSSKLEILLTRYTGERSSRGILQGMYPSDLFGNYYLGAVDRYLADVPIPSARYVDDLYVFLDSVDSADQLLRTLIPVLRSYDLVLNEAKSAIIPKSALVTEEPDLEALFEQAVAEIAEQVDDEEFDADYGFQSEWEDDDEEADEADLELEATKVLFDSVADYPGNEESIERFCLPLFSTAVSDYAVDHVTDAFKKRPSMAQIYCSYLAKFIDRDEIRNYLTSLLKESSLLDWQKMWVLAALSQLEKADDKPVKAAMDLLRDAHRHDALRAVAATFIGAFGDHTRRKGLVSIYSSVSNYVQAAIYYSSRAWPGVERSNAKATWSGHGPLHNLITIALSKK